MGKRDGELTSCDSKRGRWCAFAGRGLWAGCPADGQGGGGHLADAAEGTELWHVKLDRLQVPQVRPSAEQGRGRDDERRKLKNLILRGAGWRAVG